MNRHTGIGHWTFVEHRFVCMDGDWPYGRYVVCMHCGEAPSMGREGTHCHAHAQKQHVEQVRAARAERMAGRERRMG